MFKGSCCHLSRYQYTFELEWQEKVVIKTLFVDFVSFSIFDWSKIDVIWFGEVKFCCGMHMSLLPCIATEVNFISHASIFKFYFLCSVVNKYLVVSNSEQLLYFLSVIFLLNSQNLPNHLISADKQITLYLR